MKIRKKEKLKTHICCIGGDTIVLWVDDEKLVEDTIERPMVLTHGVIFDVEAEEFGKDVIDGIGGAFLQEKKGGD